MMRILCLNGPNLDRLGTREVEIYGTATLADLEARVEMWGRDLGCDVECFQSSHEGKLVEAVHSASDFAGIVLNPGALTHTSTSLHDAIAASPVPLVEVHISNLRERQRWRRRSFIAPVAVASITGRGLNGYHDALRALVNHHLAPPETARYGPHPDQVVDLRRIAGAELGAVLIHGGFWLDAWGRDTVSGWAVDLAARGISSASLEYRRLGSGGGRRATLADAREAADLARENLSVSRQVVVGHSAGGYLAAWLAVTAAEPAATIAVSGIFDLEAATADHLGQGAVARFASDATPSPVSMPTPTAAMTIVHGRQDRVVPADQSVRYAEAIERGGGTVTLDLVDGAGHFDFLDVTSPAWEAVAGHLPPR